MASAPVNPGRSSTTRPVTGTAPPGTLSPRRAQSTIVSTPAAATVTTTTAYRIRSGLGGNPSPTTATVALPGSEPRAQLGHEGRDGIAPVGGDADVGSGEQRHVALSVDGQDRPGRADADHVVELPGEGDGHVEVRGDRTAREADLAGVGLPSPVGHLAGGAELRAEDVEESLQMDVVVRDDPATDADYNRRLGQGVGVVVPGL